ncbi:MAG: outer membrane protein assembly factor BamD [Alphaproteobacteria bacterium]|nr:outer membrane protein assembly factor BamD [Alphaproteobacteria bacterium]OJV13482.1 MAG: hypothetical protein BGO27_04660 [Alphaproteobacteria bacterium 33-17]
MHYILAIIFSIFLISCQTNKNNQDKIYDSAEEVYSLAVKEINSKNFEKATELFEDLEKEFPYSPWSIKGQLMYSYIKYLQQQYPSAILSLEKFLQLYPLHENADYAYYLIAMCYYDQINVAGRDQETTVKAKNALEDIIHRFPDSKYAKDAKAKLDLTEAHLAAHEMQVGRFYLNKNLRIAALNRFNAVVENYSKTSYVAEALYRLTEIYYSMGAVDEAKKYAAILGHNYPNDPWYHKAYSILK